MGKFCEHMDQLIEKLNERDGLTGEEKKIHNILQDWWLFIHCSIQCAGIVLDPEWSLALR
jgi:hypothetical protein